MVNGIAGAQESRSRASAMERWAASSRNAAIPRKRRIMFAKSFAAAMLAESTHARISTAFVI